MNRWLLFFTSPFVAIGLVSCGGGSGSPSADKGSAVGVWLAQKEQNAYEFSKSRNPLTCSMLVTKDGRLNVQGYYIVGGDGTFSYCENTNGHARPININCVDQEIRVDIRNGNMKGAQDCQGKISVNGNSAVFTENCNGTKGSLFRITAAGYQQYLDTALKCLEAAKSTTQKN